MKEYEPKKSLKVTSICLIISMFFNILPAQEISNSIKNSEAKLEYYLDRAMQERQNEKWETLVEEGLLSAMLNWENENIEKLDSSDYESEKQKAEEYFEKKISAAYTKWSLTKEKDNLDTQTSILEQRLREASLAFEYTESDGTKTRIVNIDDSEDARAQWNEVASKIIAEFTAQLEEDTALMVSDIVNRNNNIDLSDEETKKIVSEFVESQKKVISERYRDLSAREENSLMNVVLYDQESLRKASDKEAAMVIAKQLAKETEAETDLEMKNLFDQFQDEIIKGELENFDLQNSDWYNRFETALNESLEIWDEAELRFLQARSDWELNAKEVFIDNEEVWQNAFKELDAKKNQWNEKIYNEIKELYVTLQIQRADLENEIETDLNNYYAMLENQKRSNDNLIKMQESIYNQNRTLMATSSEGIKNWFDHWGEKYNGLYSYWKTEDASAFNLYFGSSNSLENNDLKINTTYTVDSDGNKIYSESLSVTNLNTELNNWNIAYLDMLCREIDKEITYIYNVNINAQKQIDNSTKQINLLNYQIKNLQNRNPSDIAARQESEKYSKKIVELQANNKLLQEQITKNIQSISDYSSLKSTVSNTKKEIVENPLTKNTEILKTQLEIVIKFKQMKGVNNYLFTGIYKALWNTDDFILGTSDILSYWTEELEKSTRAANEASVELYKKAGYTLTDSGMNELENQYLKASALEQYWKEQLDIAEAVKDYAVNRTSTQEVLSETEKNLLAAIDAYNSANNEYQITLNKLNILSETVDKGNKKIEEEQLKLSEQEKILEQKQKEFNTALDIYNGLYGSVVENSINSLIEQMNEPQLDDKDKKTLLNDYYSILSEQQIQKSQINVDNFLSYLKNGNKTSGTSSSSLSFLSEQELSDYINLKLNDVLNIQFNITDFESKFTNVSRNDIQILKENIELYFNQYTDDEEKNKCKIYIEASLKNIITICEKEQEKRKLIKDYLKTSEIDENVFELSLENKAYEYIGIYLKLYSKTGALTDISDSDKNIFNEIKKLYNENNKEELYKYFVENRNLGIINKIISLTDFSDEYIYLFDAEYNSKLNKIGNNDAEIVRQIKNEYSEYVLKVIEENNETARLKLSDIIKNYINIDNNKEVLLDYLVQLNLNADGLNDVGVSALNIYINELIHNYVCSTDDENLYEENINTIDNLNYEMQQLQNWVVYEQTAEQIGEILVSDLFNNLDNENLKNCIISRAAILYLPYVQDLSSFEKIINDPVLDGIDISVKNKIAKEIYEYADSIGKYISKVTEKENENFQKLITLREEYDKKVEKINQLIKQKENYQKILLSETSEQQIEYLNNLISDKAEEIENYENSYTLLIQDVDFLKNYENALNSDLIKNDWYLALLAGDNYLYEYLCKNIFDENGILSQNGLAEIETVNAYLENSALPKLSELEKFTKTIRLIQSYNVILDGDADKWIDTLLINDELKISLKNYFEYNWIEFPEYFSDYMQNRYNSGLDRYYIDCEKIEVELLDAVNNIYLDFNKKYLKAKYEKEITECYKQKKAESLESEQKWITEKNKEIETLDSELSTDKKNKNLNIHLENIQNEKDFSKIFAEYFTDENQEILIHNSIDKLKNYNIEISAAYNSIYNDRNTRKNNITVLKEEVVLLQNMFEDSIEKQKEVNNKLISYQEQEEIVNNQRQNYYSTISEYQKQCKEYNEQMNVIQSAYNTLEDKRIKKRKADEIKRWADNEYLHDYKEIYNTDNYITPAEKYENVKESYCKAKEALNYITEIKTNKKQTVDNLYKKEYSEYTTAFDKYFRAVLLKSEVSQSIAKQEEKLKKAEEKVENARNELILTYGIEPSERRVSEIAEKYVIVSKEENNRYSFDLKEWKDNESKLDEYFYNEKSYLYTNENEEDIYVDLAQADAFDWLLEMEKRGGDYLEELVMAASYLLSLNNENSAGENLSVSVKSDKNANSILQKIHGMDSIDIYKNAINFELKLNYDKIVSTSADRENLARYLLFKDTYLKESNEQLINRAHYLLVKRSYEHVKDSADSEGVSNTVISVANGILAASFYAMITPFTPWFLVPAGAATVVSASYACTAYDFYCYENVIGGGQSSCNNNISAYEKKFSLLIEDYRKAEEQREEERKRLNMMKFGSSDGRLETMTFKHFTDAITESLKDTELYVDDGVQLLTKDYLKEIYNIDDVKNDSLKSYYNVINKDGKNFTAVSDVLNAFIVDLTTVQKNKEVTLIEKADSLRLEQKKAASEYNSAILKNIQKTETYTEKQLKELAEAAFGNNSWNEISFDNQMIDFYKLYLNTDYISASRQTEDYINDIISKINNCYISKLNTEEDLCIDVRQYENQLTYQNFENEEVQIKAQIEQIAYVADNEWIKAKEKINSSHNLWLKEFEDQLDEKRNSWSNNYSNFLTEKSEYMTTQYVYANNVSSIESLSDSGSDITKILQDSLTGLEEINTKNDVVNAIKKDLNGYVSSLYNGNLLTNLFDMVSITNTSSQSLAPRIFTANEKNLTAIDSYFKALKVQDEISRELKDNAAKLAAQQAETQLAQIIESYMKRIDTENQSMLDWEETLVRSSGYTFGASITRNAVKDSSFFNTVYETQAVHLYQNFTTARPVISLNISQNDTNTAIMTKINIAKTSLNDWSERIFGRTDTDGTPKYFYIPRSKVDLISINDYEKESLLSEEFKLKSEAEQSSYVSIRDGEFGEHLGFSPEFKDGSELDISKGREANLKSKEIHGEIGKIMLDYQWNEIIRSNGLTQMTLPVYDKKLWLSDGMFEAPSLRSIASTICDIAGSVTGQSWWLGLVDDAVFATLDLSIEKKDIGEVALGFAKAAAVNTLSCGLGAAGKTVMGAASAITNTALRITAQTAWSMGSSYIANVGAGFVNALDYNNGEVTFNWDKAVESMYSANTIAGALGAGISTSLSLSVDNKLRTTANGAEINKIYGGAINLGVSATSKLGEYSVYAAYALSQGRTLQDAFDDMGGISFNVLSLGSIADMLANGVSRTNGTGQSKLVKLADSLRGTGILELNFGSKGISARIGTGGIDVGSNLYDLVKRQSDKNAIQNYAKTAGKDKYETVWNNYIYGDTVQENTSARIADGKDELYFINNGPRGETISNGKGGRKIFIKDYGDKYQNALTLGHESYRDGIKGNEVEQFCETVEAVKAHTGMAQRMLGYNVSPGEYVEREIELLKNVRQNEFLDYVFCNYDISDDYWKLNRDGTLSYDGKSDLYDENGVMIRKSKSGGIRDSLSELLGISKQDASKVLLDMGMKFDGTSWINSSNKTDGTLKIDFDMKVGSTGLTYKDFYENRYIRDDYSGYYGPLKKINPYNVYEKMLNDGEMDLWPGLRGNSMAVSAAGKNKYIDYNQFVKNRYLTNLPEEGQDYEFNLPIQNDDGNIDLITALFLASGTAGIHYGVDVSSPINSYVKPLFTNETTYGEYDEFVYYGGGNVISLYTNFEYKIKDQIFKDTIIQRYMHLNQSLLDKNQNLNGVIGLSGNTGNSLGPHLHFDVSTKIKISPWLELISEQR